MFQICPIQRVIRSHQLFRKTWFLAIPQPSRDCSTVLMWDLIHLREKRGCESWFSNGRHRRFVWEASTLSKNSEESKFTESGQNLNKTFWSPRARNEQRHCESWYWCYCINCFCCEWYCCTDFFVNVTEDKSVTQLYSVDRTLFFFFLIRNYFIRKGEW